MRLFDAEDRGASPMPPAVRVNGKEIASEAIMQEMQNHFAETPVDARDAAIQALVVRELLLAEARKRGLAADPLDLGEGQRETDEDALIRQLLDAALQLPTPTKDECRRFYDTNITRFRSSTIWTPAHILLSASAADALAWEAAKETARGIIETLEDHPERFEQLACDHSDCPSRELGGNLGQISSGQTTPEFEAALENMDPGTISRVPVETQYGIHLIRLDRRIEGRTLPFDAVEDKIADYLADAVFRRAASQFVSLLAGQARIEGVMFGGAASPLVQ